MLRAILILLCLLATVPVAAETYVVGQSGNFGTAATWRKSATGAGELNNENMINFCAGGLAQGPATANNTWDGANVTVTNGEVIEGIAVFVRHLNNVGTYRVELSDNGTTGTIVASSTINLADLPLTSSHPVFLYMKFTTPYTSTGLTTLRFGHRTDGGGAVNGYSNCTTNYWHVFVTTATGVPPANANLMAVGATSTPFTLTMDNTTTTDYGWMGTGPFGTVEWATAAATNYYLKLSGSLHMRFGTWRMGTIATPMPPTSTAVLEFDPPSDGEFGVFFYAGDWSAVGSPRTAGKLKTWTLLSSNEAVASTAIEVTDDTGWLSGDEVAFAGTTRVWNQYEHLTLAANAGASSLTTTAGLVYAHDGNLPSRGEVGLLTRNVILRSSNSTNYAFFHGGGPAQGATTPSTIVFQWVLVKWFGAYDPRFAVDVRNYTPGSTFTFKYNTVWGAKQHGVTIVANAANGTAVIEDNVFYSVNSTCGGCQALHLSTQVVPGMSVRRNLLIGGGSYGIGDFGSLATLIGNRVSGMNGYGFQFPGGGDGPMAPWRTFEGNVAHSNADTGFQLDTAKLRLLGSASAYNEAWRNNNMGLNLAQAHNASGAYYFKAWGNAQANFHFSGGWFGNFGHLIGNSETGYTTPYGLWLRDGNTFIGNQYKNVTLGVVSGTLGAHTSCDVASFTGNLYMSPLTVIVNPVLASTTEVCGISNNASVPGWFVLENIDGDATRDKAMSNQGTVELETTVVDSPPFSLKLSPISLSFNGFISTHLNGYMQGWRIPVASGAAPTVSVRVRKTAAYNGTVQPQLWVSANSALGIEHDTVIGTFVGAADTWQTVTGTVPTPTGDGTLDFYVAVYGTAGSVYVDTVVLNGAADVDLSTLGTPYLGMPWVTELAGGGGAPAPPTMMDVGPFFVPVPPTGLAAMLPAFVNIHTIDAVNELTSMIFRVPKSGVLDKVEFKVAAVANTPDNGVRVSFQNQAAGQPDLTVDQFRVVSVTAAGWIAPGLMTSDGTDSGTKRTVVAGEYLAVVIENASFVAGDNFQLMGMSQNTSNQQLAKAQTFGVTRNTSNVWTPYEHPLPAVLKYADGSYESVAPLWYPLLNLNAVAFNTTTTGDERGMRFTVPVTTRIRGMWFRGVATQPMDVVLYDDVNVVQATSTTATFQDQSSGENYLVPFAPVTLSPGKTYRLVLKPTSVSNVTLYDYDVQTNALLDAVEGGITWYYTYRTDEGAWVETNTKRPWMGLWVDGIASGGGGSTPTEVSHPF